MNHSSRYPPEVWKRVTSSALGPGLQDGNESQWAAIDSVWSKVGCSAEMLRKWVRRGERATGVRPGLTSVSGSRRWRGRKWSFAGRARSCARRLRILPRRSLTADPRRVPGAPRGRADLSGTADRPVDVPPAQGPRRGSKPVAGEHPSRHASSRTNRSVVGEELAAPLAPPPTLLGVKRHDQYMHGLLFRERDTFRP